MWGCESFLHGLQMISAEVAKLWSDVVVFVLSPTSNGAALDELEASRWLAECWCCPQQVLCISILLSKLLLLPGAKSFELIAFIAFLTRGQVHQRSCTSEVMYTRDLLHQRSCTPEVLYTRGHVHQRSCAPKVMYTRGHVHQTSQFVCTTCATRMLIPTQVHSSLYFLWLTL